MYFDVFTLALSAYALITLFSVSWFALKADSTPCNFSSQQGQTR